MQRKVKPIAIAALVLLPLATMDCGSSGTGASSLVDEQVTTTTTTRLESPSMRILNRQPYGVGDVASFGVQPFPRARRQSGSLVAPVHTLNVMSDFWACRGRRRHMGLDLAGVGEDLGLGTPIVAVARSRIVEVGRPEDDPSRYGRPLTRGSTTMRGGERLPISREIDGYGRVYFFTSSYGASRTGAIIVTEVLDGPLEGHRVRYMHLGAIRPDLSPGMIVAAGEEIGLIGGTAIQDSAPHVHIDAENPQGDRIDLAPFLGLDSPSEPSAPRCSR